MPAVGKKKTDTCRPPCKVWLHNKLYLKSLLTLSSTFFLFLCQCAHADRTHPVDISQGWLACLPTWSYYYGSHCFSDKSPDWLPCWLYRVRNHKLKIWVKCRGSIIYSSDFVFPAVEMYSKPPVAMLILEFGAVVSPVNTPICCILSSCSAAAPFRVTPPLEPFFTDRRSVG